MRRILIVLLSIFQLYSCSRQWDNVFDPNEEEPDIPTEGIIAYYPFNGNANDESGNGNHGMVYGAKLTEDRFGNAYKAYKFDGVDDYIDIGNKIRPAFPISVSVWLKLRKFDNLGCCIIHNDKYDSGSDRYGLAIIIGSKGDIHGYYFEGFSAPWNRIGYSSNDSLKVFVNWYNIVVLFKGHKNVQIFLNGVNHGGNYDNGNGSGMTYSNNNGAIGTHTHNDGPHFVDGIIDDIRIYNRTLTEAEIMALYNEGGWEI